MIKNFFTELGTETRKEKLILAAKAVGAFVGVCAFVWLVFAFMWACYYAGVPM